MRSEGWVDWVPANERSILQVNDLAKAFDGVRAVDGVSFKVDAGELVALIGPNGAGKTTCFNLVNGQLRPDAGTIELAGERVEGFPPQRMARRGVGRTFQVAATFASMTVRENVVLSLLAHAGKHGAMFIGARQRNSTNRPTHCWRASDASTSRKFTARPWRTVMPSASSWHWHSRASHGYY